MSDTNSTADNTSAELGAQIDALFANDGDGGFDAVGAAADRGDVDPDTLRTMLHAAVVDHVIAGGGRIVVP